MNPTIHAGIENQVALADPAAAPRALQRLQQEGLTRHEALHAIGSVLVPHTRRRDGRRPGPVPSGLGSVERGFVAADVC